MEDHALWRAITKWEGRPAIQAAFEARGFSLHTAWQNEIAQFCGITQAPLLNRYWDEVALETMLCLGGVDSDERFFLRQPHYRSVFLDELFAARAPIELPFRAPPLFKCLFEYVKKIYQDPKFWEARLALIRSSQKAEAERLGIDVTGGLKQKKDVIPFLAQFCGNLDFEGRSRNRWRKKLGNGLVFEIGVWLGGNPFRMHSPLKFRIFHVDEPEFAYENEGDAVLDRLVPGVRLYSGAANDREYILAVRAFTELFNIIAISVGDGSKPVMISEANRKQ